MREEFEKVLSRKGFSFKETSDGYYIIVQKNCFHKPISVRLAISRPINEIIHRSQNGNELDGIGYFIFSLNSEIYPDYYVFTFKHLRNELAQFMIIPTIELRRRLMKNIIRYRGGENLELRLWLMGNNLYDTTSMGLEGEWYYLSKGVGGGRMIDGTDWNYSRFWNNWILGS